MKKFVLLLIVFVAMGLSNVWAYDFSAVAPSGQTLYYNIVDGNAVLTYPNSNAAYVNECWNGYSKPTGALSVPATVSYNGTTYSVTSIGNYAFWECSGLTSVTIGNSVTSIGNSAFYYCSGLMSVTIPNSVTSIGDGAFSNCWGLTSVTIPNSVTSIGSSAFDVCIGLTSVTIGNSVTSIGYRAFYNCSGLTSVVIPNSVTSIGQSAFAVCIGLTSVTIPNSVTSIGDEAFDGVGTVIYCGSASGSPWGATRGGCFYEEGDFIYEDATKATILAYIGTGTIVTIPNSVTSIGDNAFESCSGLTSVTIGNSVTSIGERAFYGCSGLTEMTVLAMGPPSLGNSVFYGVHPNIPVYIPCGRTQYYLARDVWNLFNNYQEVSDAVLTVASNNELWGTAEIQQANTCTSPTAIIRANAQSGYRFVRWNDNNTDNPRTVTVTADVTYTAYFAANQTQGIDEVEQQPTINVSGSSVTVAGAHNLTLTIYDIAGRVIVREQAVEGKQYRMPRAGVYMVKVGSSPVRKVVVMR